MRKTLPLLLIFSLLTPSFFSFAASSMTEKIERSLPLFLGIDGDVVLSEQAYYSTNLAIKLKSGAPVRWEIAAAFFDPVKQKTFFVPRRLLLQYLLLGDQRWNLSFSSGFIKEKLNSSFRRNLHFALGVQSDIHLVKNFDAAVAFHLIPKFEGIFNSFITFSGKINSVSPHLMGGLTWRF